MKTRRQIDHDRLPSKLKAWLQESGCVMTPLHAQFIESVRSFLDDGLACESMAVMLNAVWHDLKQEEQP